MVEDITIDNKDYFYMVDNKIRDTMMEFEENKLLPKTIKLLEDSNIEQLTEFKIFPTEGYYYKTPKLSGYFNIIRNLQENKSLFSKVKNTNELKYLKRIIGSKIFGSVKSDRYPNSPLPRMKDIMTLCMEDEKVFPTLAHHPWTIPKILDNLSNHSTSNPNLVELAHLTGETECLVASCETNILYREDVYISGSIIILREPEVIWNVDEELQKLGEKLIDKFNKLIHSNLDKPDKYNFGNFDREPELPRVARLGYQMNTEEHYYWFLDENRNVTDVYTKDVITTESYRNK